jgi:hypothetical protein
MNNLKELVGEYKNKARTTKSSFEKYAIKLLQDHPEVKNHYQVDMILNFMYGYEEIPVGALHIKPKRILVVADLHLPFVHKDYLAFCIDAYKAFKCEYTVFIGDVIDNHFSSYHEISTKAHGCDKELELAIEAVKPWYDAFENASVLYGNHFLVNRKAQTAGISSKWIKGASDVLNTPNWKWGHEFTINDVYYVHGEGSTARTTALRKSISTVQGHRHSECYVEYLSNKLFAMQVGVGVDEQAYTFDYNRANTKPWTVACGVILDKQPFLLSM